MRWMLESSLPKALVATQLNRAESERSVLLMLRSDKTPLGKISSRIVYLKFTMTKLNYELKKTQFMWVTACKLEINNYASPLSICVAQVACNRQFSLPAIALGVQSLIVHVPQDSNGFLSFGLALQHSRLSSSASLVAQLDFKAWGRWNFSMSITKDKIVQLKNYPEH